jgi:hypothetical protein
VILAVPFGIGGGEADVDVVDSVDVVNSAWTEVVGAGDVSEVPIVSGSDPEQPATTSTAATVAEKVAFVTEGA